MVYIFSIRLIELEIYCQVKFQKLNPFDILLIE